MPLGDAQAMGAYGEGPVFIHSWGGDYDPNRMVALHNWRSPASEYPRAEVGRARIKTAFYTPGLYHAYGQRGYEYYEAMRRLYITTLQIDGETWMVDDPPHWWAMEDHARHYQGHVLCAGLGLGLIVHAMNRNPGIDRITVVERNPDVIDLVSPQLPGDKLELVLGDFWDTSPASPHARDVDGIFWDLFVWEGPLPTEHILGVRRRIEEAWPGVPTRLHGVNNELVDQLAAESA
jgi:hypothetical protein